ncbi:MAG: alpha-galactosidase, partial [Bacteroidaceae bacterium]|nr:alpha-galactosidase [Bacteroidaceae bacterium]
VMDDGWFGDKYPRAKDNTSLGDWVVDKNKLPNGINYLVEKAKENGIKFGIWIEPEATNSVSELMEKHPDWALQVDGRQVCYGRGGTQMLLDLTNPKVQDFVFGVVDDLLTQYPDIAYIKWDANVELFNYGSTYLPKDKQSHIYIDYHKGLENVLQRIRAKYPDVVLQACGGGGGRASYGVMPYFDEFWVSDNTDALQRIYMQWGTSYFYPSISMAQHVSASPNHQTHRAMPLKFRFDVAMTGRLGMELQPKDMTAEELEFSKRAIADYKRIRPIVQFGDQYRLVSPYDKKGIASLMYVAEDGSQAVFFAYKMEHFTNMNVQRVRMDGLDANKTYKITELNVPADKQPCHLNGKLFTGRMLMNTGIELALNGEYASRVLLLEEQ